MDTTTTDPNKSEKMYSLIAGCESSEMSVKQFCKQHGIATASYYYWHKKYHAQHTSKPAAASSFELLNIQDSFTASVEPYGVYAEYKGIRFYREPSASLLKSLIS